MASGKACVSSKNAWIYLAIFLSPAFEVLNNPKSDPVESVDRSTCWVSSSRACFATQLISNSAFWEDFSGSSLRFHVSSISSFYASGSLKLAFDLANEQTVWSDRIHKCMKVSWMLASKECFLAQHSQNRRTSLCRTSKPPSLNFPRPSSSELRQYFQQNNQELSG